MKRDLSRHGHRDRLDKVDKKAALSGALKKEKSSKKRLSIYDDFEEEDVDDFDLKSLKSARSKR